MVFRWQRIATADSRTPRCESMNVSAALYLAGSSVRRGSPTGSGLWRGGRSPSVNKPVGRRHARSAAQCVDRAVDSSCDEAEPLHGQSWPEPPCAIPEDLDVIPDRDE